MSVRGSLCISSKKPTLPHTKMYDDTVADVTPIYSILCHGKKKSFNTEWENSHVGPPVVSFCLLSIHIQQMC